MPINFPIPHVHLIIDLNFFVVRCGLGYYEINYDEFRPAFIEFRIWNKWRVTFEAGKISGMHRRGC